VTTTDIIERILRSAPLPRAPESRLQDAIARLFTDHDLTFAREVRLTPEDIIDFVVDGSLGLEVKVDGSLSDVTRQLHRYAHTGRLEQLLLVTTRSRHRAMPPAFGRTPVRVLYLLSGAL